MTDSLEHVVDLLSRVARDGALRAGRGLSGLVGQEVAIHVPRIREGTHADACDAVGGPEALVLGAYLSIGGDISGHIMLLFPERRALDCVDLMSGQPAGSTVEPDDLALSALAELGNIVGSAFVNALADHVRLMLHPSPPAVIHDMALALVQSVHAEILASGSEVIMVDTVFEDASGEVAGLLIVAPDPASLSALGVAAA
jgi:chemotaxis protein CheC